MAEIMGYTRTVCENECYEAKLAYSMHLAIKTEKESFTPFNHNSVTYTHLTLPTIA